MGENGTWNIKGTISTLHWMTEINKENTLRTGDADLRF